MQVLLVLLEELLGPLPSFIDKPPHLGLDLILAGSTQVWDVVVCVGNKANLVAETVVLR